MIATLTFNELSVMILKIYKLTSIQRHVTQAVFAMFNNKVVQKSNFLLYTLRNTNAENTGQSIQYWTKSDLSKRAFKNF